MTYLNKLSSLRDLMKKESIDAYVIASSDPHISEYLPDRYKNIEWISGFTGSAGTLVITENFAGLWTDSRYFVQANEQLMGSGFQLVKLKTQGAAEYALWLQETLQDGDIVAFDGKLISISTAQQLKSKLEPQGITIKSDVDLINQIWSDRPGLPKEKAYLLSKEQTGKSINEKIHEVQQAVKKNGATSHLISSLDDIAWIFNIRGADVKCNPVVLSFAYFDENGVYLFIDQSKLDRASTENLAKAGVSIRPYEDIEQAIKETPSKSSILIDTKRNCYSYFDLIPASVQKIECTNPSTLFKAQKNHVELQHTRDTMIKDGVALTRFFYWLENQLGKERISEITIANKLAGFRAEQTGFVGESFDTIAGYKSHGALPHYKATLESNVDLEQSGLLLIDSGGQYLSGTTDVTRTISLGEPTDAEKTDYTLVLKGMIEGCSTYFPRGTRGYQIDAITRKPLWDQKRNYGHGTGHGVGFFLNVHEGPHVFNAANIDISIEPGTITSIEPGLYREGRYGIRIENLVVCHPDEDNTFGQFMRFETLTLCYIETSLIDKTLLESRHIHWLNNYHREVFDKVSPHLNPEERNWLTTKTLAI